MRAALFLALFSGLAPGCSGQADQPPPAARPGCSTGRELRSVSGGLVDEGGSPLGDGLAQLCVTDALGRSYCLGPERAGADGAFRLFPAEVPSCVVQAAVRFASPELHRAPLYCLLPAGSDARFDAPLTPPRVKPALVLPPEGDPGLAREVGFEGGLRLTLRPDAMLFEGGGSYADLAASPVPPGEASHCALGEAPRLGGLFAFAPQAQLDQAVWVRFPNTGSLPPGTTVTLYVLGGLSCLEAGGRPIAEGELAPTGQATVSDDGAEIVGWGESGLRCLTWLGWGPR